MKDKLSKRLNEMLSNFEEINNVNETKIIQADILPVITQLSETEWFGSKRGKVNACRQLIRIAESNEPIAKSFMRTLNSATKKIGNLVIEKLENGGYKGVEIIEKKK